MLLRYKKINVRNGNDQANLVAFWLKSKDKDVDFRLVNPNWHETGRIFLLIIFESDFVS